MSSNGSPSVPVLWVDAFSERPYGGNPAAVCLLDHPAPPQAMQSLAFELGLSETAFVWPVGGDFSLRWFTPAAEVDLCGHATAAAAHVLASSGRLGDESTVRFLTKSGEIHASALSGQVEIDLPAEEPARCDIPEALAARWPVVAAATGRFDLVIEVVDAAAVRDVTADLLQLAGLPHRGVIVTARGSGEKGPGGPGADDHGADDHGADDHGADDHGADYVLRYFAPRVGVPEDPVTGSAQCVLGPYWASSLGRCRLRAQQLSARRGSLDVTVDGARVVVGGRAVTVLRGTLSEEVATTLRGNAG